MKTTILSLLLCLIAAPIWAQNTAEASPKKSLGAFGGPIIQMGKIAKSNSLMMGGQGGIALNSNWAFGGFGIGNVGGIAISPSLVNQVNDLELSLGYGGIFAEYTYKRNCRIHPSISLPIGFGGTSIKPADSDTKLDRSGIIALSPRLSLGINVGKHAVISVFGSYQYLNTTDDFMLSSSELSGWQYGLSLKIGSF